MTTLRPRTRKQYMLDTTCMQIVFMFTGRLFDIGARLFTSYAEVAANQRCHLGHRGCKRT